MGDSEGGGAVNPAPTPFYNRASRQIQDVNGISSTSDICFMEVISSAPIHFMPR